MEDTNVVTITIQAALFSFVSTGLAQIISAWKQPDFPLEFSPFVIFASIALIVTPPNHLYQEWLERSFPTLVPSAETRQISTDKDAQRSERLRRSKSNVVAKFIIDQTFGAAANTIAFIALTSMFKGNGLDGILAEVHAHFPELFMAGWRMWPFISFANLSFVPWEWRPMVGNTAGLCWGVYLALVSS